MSIVIVEEKHDSCARGSSAHLSFGHNAQAASVTGGEHRVAEGRRTVFAKEGETLLSVLQRAGISVQAPCGGAGTCGKCAVEVSREAGEWQRVLACRTVAASGMEVRLLEETGGLRVDDEAAGMAGALARFKRDGAARGELGIAVDVGTTTIAAYLFDLENGLLLARGGAANPQASFGADVISRIHACSEGALDDLQQIAARGLRELVDGLCRRAGVEPSEVKRWAVAGNTVMEHILCRLSPVSIGAYPFEPLALFGEQRCVPGVDGGVYLCPCVSGYVGGDIAAGIVACGLDELVDLDTSDAPPASRLPRIGGAPSRNVLFADLGTNGEMALVANGVLHCCATATGPAFEGANISQGMQARDGAIDSCRFVDGSFAFTTVGGKDPIGICGSGLIDALAACLEAGLVDETGRLLAPDELPGDRAHLVELREGKPVALLVPDGAVVLTQKDVRALQLAKAAVAAGIASLVREAGLDAGEVDELVVGGAFGAHMRAAAAARIGLFPQELLPCVRMVGNCAGAGACAALLSSEARDRMAQVARAARYIELSLDPGFSEDYIEAMGFEEAIA